MTCEPVSRRLLEMKTETVSATNWCRLVFPILQIQKVQHTSSGDAACPGAEAREGATKGCTKACPAPALHLLSCESAATLPSCHTFKDCARSALPSAGVP